MKILLDTTAYSAFFRGNSPIVDIVRQADEILLNTVVIGELFFGFRKGSREGINREEFAQFSASPRVDIIDVTSETAERYAVILDYLRNTGNPIPTNDIWIAASAMEHGAHLLTADKHFLKIPQIITHYTAI